MTYASSKDVIGKQQLQVASIVIDKCTLVAGVGLCTATETGDAKCYNTRITCNDTANYTRGTVEVKFCQPRSNLPIGENLIPALKGDVRKSSTSITSGKGLGKRAVVNVKINDFPHHDRGIDPYWDDRTYDAETNGTFWGKFLARNPYFEGRTLKVGHGYINDTFSWDDFVFEEYDITDISGPDDGMIQITAKDILVRTYKEKGQYPELSLGKLSADITDSATSLTLLPAGIGNSDYPASGTASIGKEAVTYTRSGDTVTITARAQWGTTAKAHKEGDLFQISPTWSNVNVVDFLYELLNTGAGIDTSWLPYGSGSLQWDEEKDRWLSASVLTGILIKPESIEKIIAEIEEQFMFDVWVDAVNKVIGLKAVSPEASGETINTFAEDYEIIENSLKIKRESKNRINQVEVWYRKTDYSEKDDIEFFGPAYVVVDPTRSSADKYGSNSVKVILSRWITDDGQAAQLAGRTFSRFADTPEYVEFEIAAKDDAKIDMAGRFNLNTWQLQDFSGANKTKTFQVVELKETDAGHKLKVSGLASYFSGRYWFIAPDSTPDYSSATAEQKAAYGFICLDSGLFADGTAGYKII